MPQIPIITGFPVSTTSVSVSRAEALYHQRFAHFSLSVKEYGGKRKRDEEKDEEGDEMGKEKRK
jgi:hypothetical protein